MVVVVVKTLPCTWGTWGRLVTPVELNTQSTHTGVLFVVVLVVVV